MLLHPVVMSLLETMSLLSRQAQRIRTQGCEAVRLLCKLVRQSVIGTDFSPPR